MSAIDGWIDVARTGTWIDSQARSVSLTEAQFDRIVSAYATGDPAPAVVGHPDMDAPAYGWVDKIRRVGDRLQVRLRDIAPAFRAAVEAGAYAGRSIAFVGDRLRHVGFLGGRAPAIPGLAPTQFSVAADAEIEFSSADLAASVVERSAWESVTRVLRRMRDRIVAADGIEAADKMVNPYELENIASAAQPDQRGPTLADGGDGQHTEERPMSKENPTAAELAEERAQLDTERAALKVEQDKLEVDRKAGEAATLAAKRLSDADSALADHVEAGRVLPAERSALAALMASLPEADTAKLTFAAPDDGGQIHEAPRAVLERLLKALPSRVPYGTLADGPVPATPATPSAADKEVGRRARAYVETRLAAGESITVTEAVDAVRAGRDRGVAA